MAMRGAASSFNIARRDDPDGITDIIIADDVEDCTTINNVGASAQGIIIAAGAALDGETAIVLQGSFSANADYSPITLADNDSSPLELAIAADRAIPFPAHRTFPFPYIRTVRKVAGDNISAKSNVKS